VADRARGRVVGHALAGQQRAARIVERLRLDRVHRGLRRAAPDGDGAARRQPAPAARHEHLVGDELLLGAPGDDLEPDRALPCDDVRVIVRRHEPGAALAGDAPRNGFPVLRVTVVENRLAAEPARVLELQAGASAGITIAVRMPSSEPAAATPWAWFPEDQ